MVICLEWGANGLHNYGTADATATPSFLASLKSRRGHDTSYMTLLSDWHTVLCFVVCFCEYCIYMAVRFCYCPVCRANEVITLLHCIITIYIHMMIITVIIRWRTAKQVVVSPVPRCTFAGRMRWTLAMLMAKDFFISWTLLWFVVMSFILSLVHRLFFPFSFYWYTACEEQKMPMFVRMLLHYWLAGHVSQLGQMSCRIEVTLFMGWRLNCSGGVRVLKIRSYVPLCLIFAVRFGFCWIWGAGWTALRGLEGLL